MKKVVVVDYGIGNVLNVCRSLAAAGADVNLSENPSDILNADRLVLPGVGAFADCMNELKRREFVGLLKQFYSSGRPFLGICVGMQVMFQTGHEHGDHDGLGILPGAVRILPSHSTSNEPLKIPNIGWCELQQKQMPWSNTILDGITPGTSAYLLHSYAAFTEANLILASIDFGGHEITAAVAKNNCVGVQFHPEKSGPVGLKILSNFLKWQP